MIIFGYADKKLTKTRTLYFLNFLNKIENKKFPLNGKDLMKIGFVSNKLIGTVIEKVNMWWFSKNLLPQKENVYCMLSVFYQPVLGGKDINIASMLPSVCKPNLVPLSYKRLNSVYLDLLWDCIFLSALSHFNLIVCSTIFLYEVINVFPTSLVNWKSLCQLLEFK